MAQAAWELTTDGDTAIFTHKPPSGNQTVFRIKPDSYALEISGRYTHADGRETEDGVTVYLIDKYSLAVAI